MNTFVIPSGNVHHPLRELIDQLDSGEIQICDDSGRVLAYLRSSCSREDQRYAEAAAAALAEEDRLQTRSQRRGGLTTEELCRRVGIPYHGKTATDQ